VPALRESGAGVVIKRDVGAGQRPSGSSIPYAVSKAGVNHMTLLLARVLGPQIRVNAVAPGLVETPWTAGGMRCTPGSGRTRRLQRVARPEDVARR